MRWNFKTLIFLSFFHLGNQVQQVDFGGTFMKKVAFRPPCENLIIFQNKLFYWNVINQIDIQELLILLHFLW